MSISKEITIGESKLPAQIHRNCMHEKQMVIARQIIKRKNRGEDYREDDVPHLWGNYFPGDFKMRGVTKDDQGFGSSLWQECFSWINNYVKGQTLDECDKDLDRLPSTRTDCLIGTRLKKHLRNIRGINRLIY